MLCVSSYFQYFEVEIDWWFRSNRLPYRNPPFPFHQALMAPIFLNSPLLSAVN